jgi:hypothetical protein
MAAQAAKNARYLDINSTKYVADLLTLKDTLAFFTDLPMSLQGKNLKQILRLASSGYLSVRYGINLTVQDTLSLKEAFARLQASTGFRYDRSEGSFTCQVQEPSGVNDEISMTRSKESRNVKVDALAFGKTFYGTSTQYYTMYYSPHVLKEFQILHKAFIWDVFPKMSTALDYVPLSFVVGWIIPQVNQAVTSIDYSTFKSLVQLRGSCYTEKVQLNPVPARRFFGTPGTGYITGSISVAYYHRVFSDSVPTPPSIDFYSTPEGWSFRRFIDGSSLIFQRIK